MFLLRSDQLTLAHRGIYLFALHSVDTFRDFMELDEVEDLAEQHWERCEGRSDERNLYEIGHGSLAVIWWHADLDPRDKLAHLNR